MPDQEEVDTTFTCDGCSKEFPISQVGVTNTGPHGYFILCQVCNEAEKKSDHPYSKYLYNTHRKE